MSVWRDWFDSNPRGRSSLWVEGSIPSSLSIKGDLTMEVLLLVNFLWLGVGLYTYLTLES